MKLELLRYIQFLTEERAALERMTTYSSCEWEIKQAELRMFTSVIARLESILKGS